MTRIQNDLDIADPPSTGSWSRFEELIEAFEHAWRAGPLPNIDDFLRGESSEQEALLVELIHVDLEFRIKAGEAARVESYFDRYPRLTMIAPRCWTFSRRSVSCASAGKPISIWTSMHDDFRRTLRTFAEVWPG